MKFPLKPPSTGDFPVISPPKSLSSNRLNLHFFPFFSHGFFPHPEVTATINQTIFVPWFFPWISPWFFANEASTLAVPPTALRRDLLFHRAPVGPASPADRRWDIFKVRDLWGYDGILTIFNLVKCYIILYNDYMMRILTKLNLVKCYIILYNDYMMRILTKLNLVKCYIILYNDYMMRILTKLNLVKCYIILYNDYMMRILTKLNLVKCYIILYNDYMMRILTKLNLVKCYIILYNDYMMRILTIRMGIPTENDGQDIYIYN